VRRVKERSAWLSRAALGESTYRALLYVAMTRGATPESGTPARVARKSTVALT